MNNKKLTEVSKFLSFVLRHQPQEIGLSLDLEGWADIDALILAANKSGQTFDKATLMNVVETSDKKRFSVSEDGRRIRAAQGHSTEVVAISHPEKTPPEFLYHGTATRFLDAILKEGLKPGSRHHVHLSESMNTAAAVGQRYGKPVVLKIEALRMHQQGFKFFQADNEVWLTPDVPPQHIQINSEPPRNLSLG